MTAAEIVEEYFPSAKNVFSDVQVNFVPDADTIVVISDTYHIVYVNKSGVFLRPQTEGAGGFDRFICSIFDGKVKPADFIWDNITSMVYNAGDFEHCDTFYINNTQVLLAKKGELAQFANDLKNYARSQGANV